MAVDSRREAVKYHVSCAALMAGLMALVAVAFTVSSAETKIRYVCLGNIYECAVSEVSGLGSFCGTVGVIATVACPVWVFQWYFHAPRERSLLEPWPERK